ncbi:MAG: SpoIIE family protein phosphatase [Lachnospiraceae bacterium]|nr:SpoIIE family protein phosphatase [Lachnospiraceae bacterium]
MREWILAMLGISALLLIRDMAKIISSGRKTTHVETIYDNHPQKMKMEKYAESFEKLAESFYRMTNSSGLNQIAVAEQLDEVGHILKKMAEEFYNITSLPVDLYDQLMRTMKKRHILLKQAWRIVYPDGNEQIILNVCTKGGRCLPISEVTQILSDVSGKKMMPVEENRRIINERENILRFAQQVNFRVVYGVARAARDSSNISGDNFACMTQREGEFILCLADGMGTGLSACRESEQVVDLLEQFLDSGFSKETAAKMINSALVLGQDGDMFSTVDVCSLNLYTGVCEFLKAGAATTFIKRSEWVETITSTSLAVGLLQQTDYEVLAKKLYPGDYLIMVTDGVLDALPFEQEEETMKEIIMTTRNRNPKEMGRIILERVMSFNHYRAMDDMTVLVAGMWNNS